MKISPIKTKKDYTRALKQIETLMDAKPDTPEGDMLDVLTTLVEAYEAKHHPISPPDPIEAIRFRMEQLNLTSSDLAPYVGGRNQASEILNGKRSLTVAMLRSLHRDLGIPAESLLA